MPRIQGCGKWGHTAINCWHWFVNLTTTSISNSAKDYIYKSHIWGLLSQFWCRSTLGKLLGSALPKVMIVPCKRLSCPYNHTHLPRRYSIFYTNLTSQKFTWSLPFKRFRFLLILQGIIHVPLNLLLPFVLSVIREARWFYKNKVIMMVFTRLVH